MTIKTRLIILGICAAIFLVIAPYIIFYSLGYRIDFRNFKITPTGGIYIKALPEGTGIAIDSSPDTTTGFLSPSVFEQNLLPGIHTIVIKKDGYYTYQKNLAVLPNQVTKLEHVYLLQQNITFNLLEKNNDNFYISNDGNNALLAKSNGQGFNFEILNLITLQKENLALQVPGKIISGVQWSGDSNNALLNMHGTYFLLKPFLSKPQLIALPLLSGTQNASFNPIDPNEIFFMKNLPGTTGQIKNLYVNTQTLPVIKNTIAYQVKDIAITYLASDGFLYIYDTKNNVVNKITSEIFPIKRDSTYKIINTSGGIFLQEDQSLFLLNQQSGTLENFSNLVTAIKISPDGQKILYYNDRQIAYSLFSSQTIKTVPLNIPVTAIGDCYWLNNDYIIINAGNNIIVSEIDTRGNINTVNLPNPAPLSDGTSINIKKPDIYFNQKDKKLYILSDNILVSSEKLLP